MPNSYVAGLPGMQAVQTASHGIVFRQGDWLSDLSLGKIISGSASRDPGNTGDVTVLRAGLIMGKITSGGKYAPSIIGVTSGAYTSGGTSLTTSAASAVELVRRQGASGTFTLTGAATAAGTQTQDTVTYSAVNTTTGVITITNIGANRISGSIIGPTDGSQTPVTVIPDGYGIPVVLSDGVTVADVPFAQFPIAGVIIAANLINWPSDTTLQTFIAQNMSTLSGGKFVFDYVY